VLFHEYFHGDDGRGLGASHQTGWTALVARLVVDVAAARGGLGGDAPRWRGALGETREHRVAP
jgi:hypothetical protein